MRASRWPGRCSSSSCCTSRRRPTRRSPSWRCTPTSSAGTWPRSAPWLFTWGELGLIQICGKNAVNPEAILAACKAIAGHPGVVRLAGFRDQYGRDRALHAGDRGPAVRDLGPGCGRWSCCRAVDRRRASARHRQRPQPRHLLQDARPQRADLPASAGRPHPAGGRGRRCGRSPPHRPSDILAMVGWAFSLAMAGNFPALVLGIWWKRATTAGAICGIIAGFGSVPLLPGDDAVLPGCRRGLLRHDARC